MAIDVFAQRSPLLGEDADILNPVDLANKIGLLSGEKFIDLLTYETFPDSFTRAVRYITNNLEDNNPDYHPEGLSKLKVSGILGGPTWNTLPVFWLRNQNIDLDSCWWGYFTEAGFDYNNLPTSLNDPFWLRDLNDENIDRTPTGTSVYQRMKALKDSGDITTLNEYNTADKAVPYEARYPQWFTAHNEYEKTDAILKELGIDLKGGILEPMRENPDHEDIDHVMFGFFNSLIPTSPEEGEYLFRFFREMFRFDALVGTGTFGTKRTSPCVTHARKADGLYRVSGSNAGWCDETGSTLSQHKANNYYYEYSAQDSPFVDLNNIFTFEDSKEEMNLEFEAKNVIIRKVRGTHRSLRHNQVSVTVGKGATFPEFTHFDEVMYLEDPTGGTTLSAAHRQAYADNVIEPHRNLLKGLSANGDLIDFDFEVDTWVCFRMQKTFGSQDHSPRHVWDVESISGLNYQSGVDYYEEIIIINPRTEYRSVYNSSSKSKRAESIFHDNSFVRALSNPVFFVYKINTNSWVSIQEGPGFVGNSDKADALVVPLVADIVDGMLLKHRETVIARSMSVLTIAIIETHSSLFDDVFKAVVFIAVVVFAIIPGAQVFAAQLATITTLTELVTFVAVKYVTLKGISEISDVIIEFLVDELGFEVAGLVIGLLVAYATFQGLAADPSGATDLYLQLAANFDDSFVELTNEAIVGLQEDFQAFQDETTRRLDDLKDIENNLLGDVDPTVALATKIYLLTDESPTEFFNRTIEDKNPGIKVIEGLESEITRFKLLDHRKDPILVSEDISDADYLDKLV